MIPLLIIGFAAIALLEIPGLIQGQYWRELAAFSLLLALGFALSMLLVLGVELPYVTTAIHEYIKACFGL